MYVGLWVIILICFLTPFIRDGIFGYAKLGREQVLLLLVEILALPFIMDVLERIFHSERKSKKKK